MVEYGIDSEEEYKEMKYRLQEEESSEEEEEDGEDSMRGFVVTDERER